MARAAARPRVSSPIVAGDLVLAIQELAGHQDLSTTQRYMHLSPAAMERAIQLLNEPIPVQRCGDIVETAK